MEGIGHEAVVSYQRTPCNKAEAVKAVIPKGKNFSCSF
jgi:hypothetical protein